MIAFFNKLFNKGERNEEGSIKRGVKKGNQGVNS